MVERRGGCEVLYPVRFRDNSGRPCLDGASVDSDDGGVVLDGGEAVMTMTGANTVVEVELATWD